jgi:DNA mismatch endonuclease (patch repair protein)
MGDNKGQRAKRKIRGADSGGYCQSLCKESAYSRSQVMPTKRRVQNFQGRNFRKKRRPDILSKRKRSSLMSRIRSKGSKMEERFVEFLNSSFTEFFVVNDATVFGKPDVVFSRAKTCVFLDSDFWHGWQYPRWKHLLKTAFWRRKIERNRERDKAVTRKLRRQGWRVIRIWEHNLREDFEQAMMSVKIVVSSQLEDSITVRPKPAKASYTRYQRPPTGLIRTLSTTTRPPGRKT